MKARDAPCFSTMELHKPHIIAVASANRQCFCSGGVLDDDVHAAVLSLVLGALGLAGTLGDGNHALLWDALLGQVSHHGLGAGFAQFLVASRQVCSR